MVEGGGWDAVREFMELASAGRRPETEATGREYDEKARAFVTMYGVGCSAPEHVAFLRIVGTPQQLAADRDRALEAFHALDGIVRDRRMPGHLRPPFYSEEYGETVDAPEASGVELLKRLRELTHYLDAAHLEARRAVESLRHDGFEYKNGKLYVSDTGGAPRQVVREAVGRTWAWVRQPGEDMYSKDVLSRVRAALADVFPPEVLPDNAGMKSAIQHHQERGRG